MRVMTVQTGRIFFRVFNLDASMESVFEIVGDSIMAGQAVFRIKKIRYFFVNVPGIRMQGGVGNIFMAFLAGGLPVDRHVISHRIQ